MVELFLVRHGETSWNDECKCQGITDIPLSKKGIEQANQLGDILVNRNEKFDVFMSTSLSRAYLTCQIIKEKLNDKSLIYIEDGFLERCFGKLEGKSFEYVAKIINENRINVVDGFEIDEFLNKRVIKACYDIENRFDGKKVLLVTHSNTIKALAIYANKMYTYGTLIPNLNVSKFILNNRQVTIDDLYYIKGLGKDKTKIK